MAVTVPASTPPVPARLTLSELIDREKHRRRRRWLIGVAVIISVIALGLGGWWLARPGPVPLAARFRSELVTHGDLVRDVRATGRVDAVSSVSVGAEISGRIATVEVDYNDHVTTGQIMARFDRSALEAQRAQSQATLAAAKAQLAQARFDLEQARRNRIRSDELYANKAVTQQEHEATTTATALAEARWSAAEASVAAQEAAATVARTNLDHTVIRAPIDGIVITRDIDPGQTVASVLQSPVLFVVAADLRQMEVGAAIDEADIGEVAIGQSASFTVNAWPDRVFDGVVTEVRNSARVLQDVVTYEAVVRVDNTSLALKPGMTASVRVHTASVRDTDLVPNAALRFTPPGEAPAAQGRRVWRLESGALTSRVVRPGVTDGELTAIEAGAVSPGTRVLVDLTPEGKQAYGLVQPR